MIPRTGLAQVLVLRDAAEIERAMTRGRVSSEGMRYMANKALFRVVRVRGLDVRAANILKQEMLSRGGEVATSREVYELGGENGGLHHHGDAHSVREATTQIAGTAFRSSRRGGFG